MKFYKLVTLSIVSSLIVVGCGSQGGQDQVNQTEIETVEPCENNLIPIEVDFSWAPIELGSGEVVTFTANVSHDEVPVPEANEVKFEIWEHSNPEYHFMEEAVNEGNGSYTLDWSFDSDGVYYAYYHVTACDMHRMEKDMVVVGEVDVKEITAHPDTVTGKMKHGHKENGHSEEQHHKEETKHKH